MPTHSLKISTKAPYQTHHCQRSSKVPKSKNLACPLPWHYSHKHNTTYLSSPLTCTTQPISHLNPRKEKTLLKDVHQLFTVLLVFPFDFLIHFSSIRFSFWQNFIWFPFILQHIGFQSSKSNFSFCNSMNAHSL